MPKEHNIYKENKTLILPHRIGNSWNFPKHVLDTFYLVYLLGLASKRQSISYMSRSNLSDTPMKNCYIWDPVPSKKRQDRGTYCSDASAFEAREIRLAPYYSAPKQFSYRNGRERGTQCCAFGCTKRKKTGVRSDSEGSDDEESAKKRLLSRTFYSLVKFTTDKT